MMARMMSRFPKTVTRYMDRNSPKRMVCKSGSSESPMRWNSKTVVWFSGAIEEFVSLITALGMQSKIDRSLSSRPCGL